VCPFAAEKSGRGAASESSLFKDITVESYRYQRLRKIARARAYHSISDQLCDIWRLVDRIPDDIIDRQRRDLIFLARSLSSALFLNDPHIREFTIFVASLGSDRIVNDNIFRTSNSTQLRFEVLSGCKPARETGIAECLEEDGVVV
jgi:hypothetical protein